MRPTSSTPMSSAPTSVAPTSSALAQGRARLGQQACGAIDALLGRAVAVGEVPGLVALGLDKHGAIYTGAFGRRGLDPDAAAMSPDTVFWYASLTKALVAACALLLVERGQLALDQPAADLLPELAHPQVLEGFASDGAPLLRPARRPITLRHLLTHTSGFGYETWNEAIRRYAERHALPGARSGRRAALRVPLVFDPGEGWTYSIGIDWVGLMIEAASGTTLGRFLAEFLLEPLGMHDTGFEPGPAQRARLADLHVRLPDGTLQAAAAPAAAAEREFEPGGSGLYGTAADYACFLRMMLNGGLAPSGRRVLSAASMAALSGNLIGDLQAGALRSVRPDLACSSDFFPGQRQGWSAGFLVNLEPSPHGRSAMSLSWGGLANCYYWIDPASGVAGLVATQLLPFADPAMLRLCEGFERALYDGLG